MSKENTDLNFYKNKILNQIKGFDEINNIEKNDIVNKFTEIFNNLPLQTNYNDNDIYKLINYERIDFQETYILLDILSKSLGLDAVNDTNKLKISSHIFQTKINEYFNGDWYFSLSMNSSLYMIGMLYIQIIINMDKKYYMNSEYLSFFENIVGKLKALKILILSKIEENHFDDKYLNNEVKSSFKAVYYTLDEMKMILEKILDENKIGVQAILTMPKPYI